MNYRIAGLCFALLATIWLSASPAHAQILLKVDVSNPNTITFTATTGLSANGATDFWSLDGIDLTSFLKTAVTPLTADTAIGNTGDAPNLQPAQGGRPYFGISVDNFSGAYRDINLWANFTTDEIFIANTLAFTGQLTWDLSSADHAEIRAALPAAGAVGNLYVGMSLDPEFGQTPVLIGTWEVVGGSVAAPEPSSTALILLGAFVLACSAYRRSWWNRQA